MTVDSWYAKGSTTTIEGLEVFFRRAGSGEALLCIHGFPTSSWDYEPMWPALTARFDVVASDLIGLGRSAKPRGRALPVGLQATVLEGLLLEQDIERAHILAHDLGDTVAQELLARQKAGTAKVQWQSCVFLNGGLFPETHRPRFIQRLLASPLGPVVAGLSSERLFRRNLAQVFSDEFPPSEAFLRGSWDLLVGKGGRQMLPPLIRYMEERRVHRQRWVGPLQESSIPLRFINGALDPVSGRHAAQRYRDVVPEPDVVMLDRAGHYPHVEQTEEVTEAFLAFHDERVG
ncbi:MAG: alpha/beta hydrolase [Myxococcota bacterium]